MELEQNFKKKQELKDIWLIGDLAPNLNQLKPMAPTLTLFMTISFSTKSSKALAEELDSWHLEVHLLVLKLKPTWRL